VDKYQCAISLMKNVISARNELLAAVVHWDILYRYIYENFEKPKSDSSAGFLKLQSIKHSPEIEAEISECMEVLGGTDEEITAKIESIPPEFSEVIFPVAIARYLIREHRVPLDPYFSETFSEFHTRYGFAIVTAGLKRCC
jgi:hypothetical protein